MTQPGFVGGAQTLRLSNQAQLELLRSVIERGVPMRMPAHGHSMWPFIRDGDILTVAPLARQPKVGEVVAFITPTTRKLSIHRVIAAQEQGTAWLIRGDNCADADGLVPRADILGVVVRVEHGGHDVRLGLGTERAWIAALNQGEILTRLNKIWRWPRRAATHLLVGLQGLRLYRHLARRRAAARLTVGEAGAADLEAIQLYFKPFAFTLAHAPTPCTSQWVARSAERVVGIAQLVCFPQEHPLTPGHWLVALEVRLRDRGQGSGEMLARRALAQAAAQGAPAVFVLVSTDHIPAMRLCRKLGFESTLFPKLEAQLQPRRMVMCFKING